MRACVPSWPPCCPPQEIHLISHRDPAATALYHTVEALDASGEPQKMQLSGIHYLPAARDATGACAALAAAGAGGSADALHAWSLAALVSEGACCRCGMVLLLRLPASCAAGAPPRRPA